MVEVKRWQKVSIWIVSIVIVLVVGGIFAANYAVDKVLNSMIGMSVDDVLGEESEGTSSSDSSSNNTPDSTSSTPNGGESTNADGSQGNVDSSSNSTDGDTPTSNSDKQASNSNGDQSSTNGSDQSGSTGTDGYTAEVSKDKAKEVEENITVSEKAKVVSILMGSLSASDISALQKLAGGGLTVEEKREAKALLLEKLTEDQYNELIAIAAKHGLSKGKTYAESKN